MANKKPELTHWRKLDGKLPLKTIMLTWNSGEPNWLSSPIAFDNQEMADQYAKDCNSVAYLVIPDAREVLL